MHFRAFLRPSTRAILASAVAARPVRLVGLACLVFLVLLVSLSAVSASADDVHAAPSTPTSRPPPPGASEVQVAVAANFAGPMRSIAAAFLADTGHRARITPGATGTLYAQIRSGAPFDVFLAADQATPQKLESDGLAAPSTRFTYALGKLVLWSPKPGYVDPAGLVLERAPFQHLAIANPRLAPYGAAAVQTLGALGVFDAVRSRIVQGESIAQAYQFVATGNAELGFVALSQVLPPPPGTEKTSGGQAAIPSAAPAAGSMWVVPAKLYAPIRQDAVLLRTGAANAAARSLLDYLRTTKAKDVIRAYGYELEER